MEIKTKRGYDLWEVSSAVQKAIRRNQPDIAGYFALELFHSGFSNYLWKRLLTISAEDCWGIITKEILALYEAFKIINKNNPKKDKGRIFISKVILLLCEAKKSRDADHLQNFIYDKNLIEQKAKEFLENISESEKKEIPDYAFDCHTLKGRIMGKTKEDFFKEELNALDPKQKSLFDWVVNQ